MTCLEAPHCPLFEGQLSQKYPTKRLVALDLCTQIPFPLPTTVEIRPQYSCRITFCAMSGLFSPKSRGILVCSCCCSCCSIEAVANATQRHSNDPPNTNNYNHIGCPVVPRQSREGVSSCTTWHCRLQQGGVAGYHHCHRPHHPPCCLTASFCRGCCSSSQSRVSRPGSSLCNIINSTSAVAAVARPAAAGEEAVVSSP